MRKNASRPDAENPEWTVALPAEVVEAIRRYRGQRGRRGPQKAPVKELISLRVDRDVVEALRATGRGWQTRVNEALRAYAMTDASRGSAAPRRRLKPKARRD